MYFKITSMKIIFVLLIFTTMFIRTSKSGAFDCFIEPQVQDDVLDDFKKYEDKVFGNLQVPQKNKDDGESHPVIKKILGSKKYNSEEIHGHYVTLKKKKESRESFKNRLLTKVRTLREQPGPKKHSNDKTDGEQNSLAKKEGDSSRSFKTIDIFSESSKDSSAPNTTPPAASTDYTLDSFKEESASQTTPVPANESASHTTLVPPLKEISSEISKDESAPHTTLVPPLKEISSEISKEESGSQITPVPATKEILSESSKEISGSESPSSNAKMLLPAIPKRKKDDPESNPLIKNVIGSKRYTRDEMDDQQKILRGKFVMSSRILRDERASEATLSTARSKKHSNDETDGEQYSLTKKEGDSSRSFKTSPSQQVNTIETTEEFQDHKKE